jgi:class 3 adenylate cyclase
MGLHFGQVNIDSQGDRQGSSVNFAARIESAQEEQFHQTRLGIQKEDLEAANRILISEVVNDEIKSAGEFHTRLVGYSIQRNYRPPSVA